MIRNVRIFEGHEQRAMPMVDLIALPRIGERLVMPMGLGDLAYYRVEQIEHHPTPSEPTTAAGQHAKERGPWAILHVAYDGPALF
jgi:hypothetical protein